MGPKANRTAHSIRSNYRRAVAQHEADCQQRYKVGYVDKIKWQYS